MIAIRLICILLILPLFGLSQNQQNKFRVKSWQTLAYLITATQAEQFIKWDSIPLGEFEEKEPASTFKTGSPAEDSLPTGNYILVSATGMFAEAKFVCVSKLSVLSINNKHQLQLQIKDKEGMPLNGAKVFINGKEAKYNNASGTFWAGRIKGEEAFVKVYAAGDTLYKTLYEKDDYSIKPLSQQRRQNWRHTKLHSILNWFPSQIKKLFTSSYRKPTKIGAQGYIVFNQPKYKPLDTVKFKGYVLDKKTRQYKKDVNVFLSYNYNGKAVTQLISTLSPASPGAYYNQFVLPDTVPMDVTCRLIFKSGKQKEIIQNYFKTEDYLLDEIGSYNFNADKEVYFKSDSLRFSASAKDANGLNVMGAKATLLLTTKEVNKFYKDTLFVADTIYNKELPLLTTGETKFTIAAADLPKADISINAKLIFQNSNNELYEENTTIEYKYLSREIVVTQHEDSLKVVYLEDGIKTTAIGEFSFNDEDEKIIQFPATIKIEPTAEDYWFYINNEEGRSKLSKGYDVQDNYHINFLRISSGDTLGFALYNPYKIPVYFTVLNGSNVIATGKQTGTATWQKVMANKKQLYKVRWQYYWAGNEHTGEESIGLLNKLLNIKISGSQTVFPGQHDSLQIDVVDYKGNPAPGVNLTAVSYNNQFNKDIRVKDLPYIAKYKGKKTLLYPGFENNEDAFDFSKTYLLGKHKALINKLGLDTMAYYKMLFPINGMYDEATAISNFLPQLSVNMMQNGVPQEIYLLYINRKIVYYNGVSDKMKNAFEVFPSNVQLGIRLRDRYIEIDSLYMQPYYKHDLSFDIDKLPLHSKITAVDKHWSDAELNLLEQSIWQMQNDYKNNNAYLWQGSKLVHLQQNRAHIAGPFNSGNIIFFSPGNFDMAFNFEPGFQYQLSKQILRLEKKALFPWRKDKNLLPVVKYGSLVLGDTIVTPPVIFYPEPEKNIYLKLSNQSNVYPYSPVKNGSGTLQFSKPKDSSFLYFILLPEDTANATIVLSGNIAPPLKNINTGIYTLLMVTNKYYTAQKNKIEVKPGFITCVKMDSVKFIKNYELLEKIKTGLEIMEIMPEKAPPAKNEIKYAESGSSATVHTGGGKIQGKITDKKGKLGIAGVVVQLKGYTTATASDAEGDFSIASLRPGKYLLVFSGVGYEKQENEINLKAGESIQLEVMLKATQQSLEEVVVVGYGTRKMKHLTGSVTSIEKSLLGYNNELAGRVAGVQISVDGEPGANSLIRLRGLASIGSNTNPLYVIDGIFYDELPKNFDAGNVAEMNVLKDAVAIYGARAANGVIVITTKIKTFRQQFKDYALWQPNFFSDKNGQAKISIQYPDNVTGWKTFVLGMDKKNRMGKSSILTQAYKPIVAELSVPQFLIEGDTVSIIGKSKNYTNHKYNVSTSFSLNGIIVSSSEKELQPNNADITKAGITCNGNDTLKASFSLQSTKGFKDGEERKIPVFKKGTEESEGSFWLLPTDSVVAFKANENLQQLHIYAQSNTLDMLLEEIENLKRYPYYCMEQTASKLTGLALEKKIRAQLIQPFKNQQEIDRLLQKIQKAQLFDGGWAWWENGKANFNISNYITNALLRFRQEPLVETNIRNAFLYLQNQLPFLNQAQLLSALYTLSNGGHEQNYKDWLGKIRFDSLTQQQQWQYVSIKQQQKLIYEKELKKLLDKKTATMLGGIHWGVANYSWHSNDVASTVMAYKVLSNEPAQKSVCQSIIQYFLEKRSNGFWANTVESATILDAILPDLLQQQKGFNHPVAVKISGDTSFVISNFPYKTTCSSNIKNISIDKTGGGMVYFTAYQNFFNSNPNAVEDKFVISTSLKQSNQQKAVIKAGEKITMQVMVNVLKDAEYVQIEIPIPAGCTYASKENSNWRVHKAYYKNKVLLFAETLSKGIHHFDIELVPAYNGSFTLNPAKASLMYFPVFYGRNEIRKIVIKD